MVNAVMQAVKDNKELREAVEEVQPEVVAVSLRLSQSRPGANLQKHSRELSTRT